MKPDARACAARVLLRVIIDGRSLSDALPPAVQQLTDTRQRALVQELSFGTLRWYYRLDALLQRLLQKSLKQRDADVRCLLLTGLYQLTSNRRESHWFAKIPILVRSSVHFN